MRSNLILSLTATAFGFGIVGVSAAPMDLTSHAAALQANITAGNLQPLASMGFNQKGLAAIKPAGAGPSQSTLTSNDIRSSVSKMGAVNMIRHPDSPENRLSNNVLSGSSKTVTHDLLRPPSK
jgi:hypothetical protein